MPSQRTVALSLDKETLAIWDGMPRGERSKRVRDALKNAELVWGKDNLIKALRGKIKQAEKEISDMKLFGMVKE